MKKISCLLILIVIFLTTSSLETVRTIKNFPVLLFKANSTAFDTIQDYSDEYKGMDSITMIMNIVNVIKSDPQLKMIIEGFYDSKETVKDLGLKRAEKVRSILIQNGVSDT